MPRLDPLAITALTEDSRKKIVAGEKLMGFIPNDGLTMARKPALLSAFLELVQVIYEPSQVDSTFKRLIGLVASSSAGCQYCVAHTANSAIKHGVDEERLQAVWNFKTSPLFSDKERSALEVAYLSAHIPNGVTDEIYKTFAQFYNEDEQLEIIGIISMFGFLNRWNSTISTDLESSPMQALERFNNLKV